MASRNYITVIFSIFIMVILSSGAPVTPQGPQVIMCQPWLLCGMVAYNPQDSQCCNDGSVQSLSLQCGPKLDFNPCSQHCCPFSDQEKYIVVNKTKGGTEKSDCEMASFKRAHVR
ncbi:insulin growth factor-like family member 1 [Petaurus breviceps papuanus]|uniref:insulin growth factor-like family member 1 n=1 Tax=Petaurus breviceps papuanus TaxID=3040969 RepID=UPI0036DB3577